MSIFTVIFLLIIFIILALVVLVNLLVIVFLVLLAVAALTASRLPERPVQLASAARRRPRRAPAALTRPVVPAFNLTPVGRSLPRIHLRKHQSQNTLTILPV